MRPTPRAPSGLGPTLVTLLVVGSASPARGELAAIWALDDGTKVKATELSHRLERGNGVFAVDPPRVSLFGARNETIAFQLILEGGAAATRAVSVRLEAVGPIRNEGLSDDPERYFIGRRIEVFKQHYLEVTRRSASIPWAPGTAAEPPGMRGWIPDALIPLAPTDRFEVPAGRNQGVWVDLYVPKDTPPGKHRGTLTVAVDGRPCDLPACRLPVELELIDRVLPDAPSAKTMLTFSGTDDDRDAMPARYVKDPWNAPDDQVEALRARHFKLLRRHRITGFLGHDKKPTAALQRRISGEAFSRDAGYEGPGEGLGQDLYSIHTYGTGTLDARSAKVWHDWFAAHGPQTTYFYYVIDEPAREDFAKANRRAARAAPVPTFITHRYDPALEVDIFCALTEHYSAEEAEAARAAGKQPWIYNGTRPFAGSFMTDDVAVAPRVNAWIQHKFGIARWFYWESTYYKDDQGGRGQIDVWTEPLNYANGDGDKLNGDGLLIYPGRDLLFPSRDRGFDGPLPSIRLKNWRRGIEDVEYLVLAKKAGHAAFVDELLSVLVPRALADETEAGAPVAWPEDGEKWLAARRRLFELLKTGEAPEIEREALSAPEEPAIDRLKRSLVGTARGLGKKKLAAIAAGALVLFVAVIWLVVRWRRRRYEDDDYDYD